MSCRKIFILIYGRYSVFVSVSVSALRSLPERLRRARMPLMLGKETGGAPPRGIYDDVVAYYTDE